MTTKKNSIKPASNAKADLAKGAEAIRAALAKKKSNPAKAGKGLSSATSKKEKKPKAKNEAALIVLPKVVFPKEDIGQIMARCVTLNKDGTSLKIEGETTTGEALCIFDNLEKTVQLDGLLLGDAINGMSELKSFEGKFAAVMASKGRSIDRCRTLASVAKNTPPSLRGLHPDIKVEHLRALVRIPELEDKKALAKEMVEAAEAGKPMKVADVVKKAEKIHPTKKGKKKKPATPQKAAKVTRDITFEEKAVLLDMEDKAAALESIIESASFLLEAKPEFTITLREKLERIARFSGQLA